MFAISARRWATGPHVFRRSRTPTGQIADVEIDAASEDLDRVRASRRRRCVTFEFENVPAATAEAAACVPGPPRRRVLHTTRTASARRLSSKPTASRPRFAAIRKPADLAAAGQFGSAILKRRFRYDGKGQYRVSTLAEAEGAWVIWVAGAVLEALVDFEAESRSLVSVLRRQLRFLHPSLNAHVAGNWMSPQPPPSSRRRCQQAIEITRGLLEQSMSPESSASSSSLTATTNCSSTNLAPRPPQLRSLTTDACITIQFEQQLRAVCGLPLAATENAPAAAWLICWEMSGVLPNRTGPPPLEPDVKLHLYGNWPPSGRKMGT